MRAVFAGLLEVVALGLDVVGNNRLIGGLSAAIGISRANWAVLGNGDHVWKARCVAINGGRRGEDNVGDVVFRHAAEQTYGAVDIGAVVLERYFT